MPLWFLLSWREYFAEWPVHDLGNFMEVIDKLVFLFLSRHRFILEPFSGPLLLQKLLEFLLVSFIRLMGILKPDFTGLDAALQLHELIKGAQNVSQSRVLFKSIDVINVVSRIFDRLDVEQVVTDSAEDVP